MDGRPPCGVGLRELVELPAAWDEQERSSDQIPTECALSWWMPYLQPTATAFGAFATLTAATVAGVIAYYFQQQNTAIARENRDIAELKVRMDLHDRRYAIYKAVPALETALAYSPAHPGIGKELKELNDRIGEAFALFPRRVQADADPYLLEANGQLRRWASSEAVQFDELKRLGTRFMSSMMISMDFELAKPKTLTKPNWFRSFRGRD